MENKIERCLQCKTKPCKTGCPLHNDITEMIHYLKEGKEKEAYESMSKTTVLGSLCGRICPQQKQCEGKCIRGIKGEPVAIGEIEAFLFDKAIDEKWYLERKNSDVLKGKKVAVVGSGPAGLTCAAFLAREGAKITIYEKREQLGGLLRYGIPDFRLPKEVLDKTIESIFALPIEAKTNQELTKDITIDNLSQEYDAVFLSFGANISSSINIPGEDLEGVLGGNELLESGNHPDYTGKKVAIIGGGNVAMDSARTIKRMGAEEVTIVYRRSREEMPAEEKEIAMAEKEGIQFSYQTDVREMLGNKKVEAMKCIRTELIEKEGETRKVPVPIPDSEFTKEVDYVVLAIGSHPDHMVIEKLDLAKDSYGYIKVDENQMTAKPGVFAGGDIIGTKATVAFAASSGRKAADKIKEYLQNK